jgi:PIN domain nuclease of toxin-antitoxin system
LPVREYDRGDRESAAASQRPFDRLLIAQAQVEGITLLSVDPRVAQRPGPTRAV